MYRVVPTVRPIGNLLLALMEHLLNNVFHLTGDIVMANSRHQSSIAHA